MEKYIQEGDLLLYHNEWAGGVRPKDKINTARHKLVKKGQAEIVLPEDYFPKKKVKITRKGKLKGN